MVKDDKEDLKEAMAKLLELIKQESNLKVRTDENFLLRHLRAAEGNPTIAFEKLRNFYTLKKEHPEWYATEPPAAYKTLLDMGSDYVLQDRDSKGRRVWIHKARNIDTTKSTISGLSQMHDLLLETILDEDETQRNGMAAVCDLKDFPWALLKWLSPTNARISARKADSLPFPKLEYHVVNTSIIFSVVLKIIYPFLSAKQKESLFIHGDDFAALHAHIDPSILPEEYGGKRPNPEGDLNSLVYSYSEQLTVNLNLGYTS